MQRLLILVCFSVAFLVVTSGTAFAQEAAEAAAATAAEPEADTSVSLIGLFKAGGWAMYVLLFLSVCCVGLIIYNFLIIREKAFLRPDLVEQLKSPMNELQLDQVKEICDENPTVITNIVYAGLDRVDGEHLDPEAVKEAMEESSSEELAAPFVMINYISIIATLSPMVGLLGTVSGMVKAFRAIASQGMGQPQVLADNISEALITTASGLIVAIPAMFFYFFFKNRYGKIASRVSKLVGDLYFEMVRGIRKHAEA